MKIVEATKKDINSIVKLAKELANFHRKFNGYYRSGKERETGFKEWLTKNFGKRNFKVLVAKEKNTILAYGIASIQKVKNHSYIKPPKFGNITNLYVKAKYRRRGIGKQIFNEFLSWFKLKNIKNIELSVDIRNRFAIKAYKKYGFFEFQKKMRMDL